MRQGVVFYICVLFSMMTVQTFAAPENQQLNGVLIDMNIRKRSFSVSADRKTIAFLVNKDTVFMQGDNRVFFSDIVPGDTVEVAYQIKGEKRLAQSVRVKPPYWRRRH